MARSKVEGILQGRSSQREIIRAQAENLGIILSNPQYKYMGSLIEKGIEDQMFITRYEVSGYAPDFFNGDISKLGSAISDNTSKFKQYNGFRFTPVSPDLTAMGGQWTFGGGQEQTIRYLNELKSNPSILNNALAADTETIGVKGKGSHFATQVSVGPRGAQTTYLVRPEGEALDYIQNAIKNLEAGGSLTQDEYRSLHSLLDYSGKDFNPNEIKKNKILFGSDLNVSDVRSGLSNLNKYGRSQRVVGRRLRGLTKGKDVIWHNAYGFDVDVMNKTFGEDVLGGARNIDSQKIVQFMDQNPLSHRGYSKEGMWSLGSIATIDNDLRHTAAGDAKAIFSYMDDVVKGVAGMELPGADIYAEGSRLYANSSLSRGEYDFVYTGGRINGLPKRGYAGNSRSNFVINRDTTYTLHKIAEVSKGDKKSYMATLFNEETGAYHNIARSSKDELYGVIHDVFSPDTGAGNARDKFNRVYGSMFNRDSGWYNMQRYTGMHNMLLEGKINVNDISAVKQALSGATVGGSAVTQKEIENYLIIKGRLGNEIDVLNSVVGKLNAVGATDAQGSAILNSLSTASKQTYRSYGKVPLFGGGLVLDLSNQNQNSIQQKLNQFINDSKVPLTVNNRAKAMRDVAWELRANKLISSQDFLAFTRGLRDFRAGGTGKSPTAFTKFLQEAIKKQTGAGGYMDVAMSHPSQGYLAQSFSTKGGIKGLLSNILDSHIPLPPNSRLDGRRSINFLEGLNELFADEAMGEWLGGHKQLDGVVQNLEEIIKNPTNRSTRAAARGYHRALSQVLKAQELAAGAVLPGFAPNGKIDISGIDDIISNVKRGWGNVEHNIVNEVGDTLSRNATTNRLHQMGVTGLDKNVGNTLIDHLQTFGKQLDSKGLVLDLHYNQSKTGLKMYIYDSTMSSKVVKYNSLGERIYNPNLAAEAFLPIDNNGMLTRGGTTKINNIIGYFNGAGDFQVTTLRDQLGYSLTYAGQKGGVGVADEISRQIARGDVLGAQKYINNIIHKSFSNAAGANRWAINPEVSSALTASSEAANWVRGGFINIEQAMNNLLKSHSKWTWNSIGTDIKRDMLRDFLYGDTVLSDRNVNSDYYSNKILRRKVQALNGTLGKYVNVAGVKAEALMDGIVAFRDPRALVPFGSTASASKDQFLAITNYRNLSTDTLAPSLHSRMGPSVITQTMADVARGKSTGINVKYAKMNDKQLYKLMMMHPEIAQEVQSMYGSWGTPKVNEGMMMLRQDIASGFTARREVRKTINGGVMLTKDGRSLLENFGGQNALLSDMVVAAGSGKDTRKIALKKGDILKNVIRDSETGALTLVYDELDVTKTGSKILSNTGMRETFAGSGNKIFNLLGVDAIVMDNGLTTQSAAEQMSGAFSLVTKEAGVRKARRAMKAGKLNNLEQMIVGIQGNAFVIRDEIPANLNPFYIMQDIIKLSRMTGVSLYQDVNGEKIFTGAMELRKAATEDWARSVGGEEGLAKYGQRELEMLRGRIGFFKLSSGGALDLTPLYNEIKRQVTTGDTYNVNAITDVVKHYIGTNNNEYLTYVTSGANAETRNAAEIAAGRKGKFIDPTTGELIRTPTVRGVAGFDRLDVQGTMLDTFVDKEGNLQGTINDLARKAKMNERGMMVELPFAVNLENGKAVKSVLMANMAPNYVNGEIMPNSLQQTQTALLESIHRYAEEWDPDERARIRSNIEFYTKRHAATAVNMMQRPHDYAAENLFSTRMKHSGAFDVSGYNVMQYAKGTGAGSAAQEGIMYVHPSQVRNMLGGASEAQLSDVWKGMTGQSGIKANVDDIVKAVTGENAQYSLSAIVNRFPTIGKGSVLPAMIRAVEDGSQLSEKAMWMTLGTAARLAADNDGDKAFLYLPYLDKQAKTGTYDLMKLTEQWYQRELSITRNIGEKIYSKLLNDNPDITSGEIWAKVGSGTDKAFLGEIENIVTSTRKADQLAIEAEARLNKTIGQMSNLSYKYRILSEAAEMGSEAAWSEGGGMVEAIMRTMEQKAAISAKHFEKVIASGGDVKAIASAQDRIIRALQSGNIEGLFDPMKDLGLLENIGTENTPKWALTGTMADEVIEQRKLMQGANLGSMVGNSENLLWDDITRSFNDLNNRLDTKYDKTISQLMDDASVNFGMKTYYGENAGKAIGDIEKVFGVEGIASGNEKIKMLVEMMEDSELRNKFKEDERVKMDRLLEGLKSTLGREAPPSAGSGANALNNMLLRSGPFNKVSPVIGALAGLWAVSAAVRAPSIDQSPAYGAEDQAPSSDGSYVDPVLANEFETSAPSGAGPTARLSQRGAGYEKVSINIKGKSTNSLTNDQIAGIIESEVGRQAGINLNINISSQDNRSTIDKQWLEDQFMSAVRTGRAKR